ncbi:hypothetical protein [Arcobacter vandammei]|uniref:hypothetical protein n=1 Tax=Arcobacter vandammei TaxID=2782243 RepID=UPI0018DF054F|nr:hypothetical protein [Arcobacter vandammei]
MLDNIIESYEYRALVEGQIKEQISFLLSKEQEFSVVLNVSKIDFNPQLPEYIMENINHFALFTLANYTYSTISLYSDFMTFETGFGAENIGSVLSVPYYSILQIVVDEKVIFLNHTATVEDFKIPNQKRSSVDVFKSNPKNKKFSS